MSAHRWTLADIPDLSGRRALVTGVTSGIGEHTVLELARRGAEVVMAARSEAKLEGAVADIRRVLPNASLVPLVVDLADLTSVRRAAAEAARLGPLDLLVNNAGVMATPYRRTVDGFELQLGTNHLGPAALTWLLMPALRAAGDPELPSRVVTTSSLGHRTGGLDLTDPHWDRRRYSPTLAYGASKIANLLFAAELDRLLRRTGDPVLSVAAHPGLTASELLNNSLTRRSTWRARLLRLPDRLLSQPVTDGIAPQLRAATGPVRGGDYVGPTGAFETRGPAGPARLSATARNPELARELWELTAATTGVTPDPDSVSRTGPGGTG